MIIPIIVHDRLYIQRDEKLIEILDKVRKEFTYQNPDYAKKRSFGFYTGNMPKTIETYQHIDHPKLGDCISIPRGGMEKIRKIFLKFDLQPMMVDKRLSLPPIHDWNNNVILRPDQEKLLSTMLKKECCLIRSPTGSGKTETSLKLAEYILKTSGPVMILLWDKNLMKQWIKKVIERFNVVEVGTIGGGFKERIRPITIAMQQTVKNKLHKYIHLFGGIIADEVQRFAAQTFFKTVDKFPARYRIGVSADETRRDKKEFITYDIFGNVADEIKKSILIKQGKIHEVIIRIIPTNYKFYKVIGNKKIPWLDLEKVDRLILYKDLITDMISDNERNELIFKFIYSTLLAKHYIVVMSERVAHAKYINKILNENKFKSGLMLGMKEYEIEFDNSVNGLMSKTLHAGVGTINKLGQALDIPNWNRGFMVTPKAGNKQALEQVIGRLTRPDRNKTNAICYYFWDKHIQPRHLENLKKNHQLIHMWDGSKFNAV